MEEKGREGCQFGTYPSLGCVYTGSYPPVLGSVEEPKMEEGGPIPYAALRHTALFLAQEPPPSPLAITSNSGQRRRAEPAPPPVPHLSPGCRTSTVRPDQARASTLKALPPLVCLSTCLISVGLSVYLSPYISLSVLQGCLPVSGMSYHHGAIEQVVHLMGGIKGNGILVFVANFHSPV